MRRNFRILAFVVLVAAAPRVAQAGELRIPEGFPIAGTAASPGATGGPLRSAAGTADLRRRAPSGTPLSTTHTAGGGAGATGIA